MASGRGRAFFPNRYTRFLRQVDTKNFDPSQCWPWLGGGRCGNGYGTTQGEDGPENAHRVSYRLFCGDIQEGHDVCHSCDNRWCVNPDHLYAATHKKNMEDCVARGRAEGGNRKHLREGQVQEIRRRLLAGHAARKISIQMDVNYTTVRAIASGRSYVSIG